MLKVEKDFEEFVELLNKFSVEYMIVGAYALALYSRPRNTGDIDVFINSSSKNAKQIIKVIEEFGFENAGIEENDFMTRGRIVQLGVSPVRIDIINEIDGINFLDAYKRKEIFQFGNVSANFISRQDIIANKKASNRKKDQADLDELEKFNDGDKP
ncbi:MAG: nucleotidyltransferase [Ignavibacteriaceae bacterium]